MRVPGTDPMTVATVATALLTGCMTTDIGSLGGAGLLVTVMMGLVVGGAEFVTGATVFFSAVTGSDTGAGSGSGAGGLTTAVGSTGAGSGSDAVERVPFTSVALTVVLGRGRVECWNGCPSDLSVPLTVQMVSRSA